MKIGKIVIAMLLITSMFGSLSLTTEAGDYKPLDANTETGIYFNYGFVEVGDAFNATLYLNPGGETVTAWYIWNLTVDYDRLGMVAFTGSWIPGWWREQAGAFWSNGTYHNETGNLTGAQSFVAAGQTNNLSTLVVNMTALYPGILNMNFSNDGYYSTTGVQVANAGGFVTNHTNNQILRIYPQEPATFVASQWNYTAINLTWTTDLGIDNITICGNTSGYPGNPGAGELLYNYSVANSSFNHTDLNNCTTWYYRAWGYNVTTGIHSYMNLTATAQTQCYTNFTLTGASPTNGSTYTNCTYSVPVNVTVIHSGGLTYNWWLNTTSPSTQVWSGTGHASNSTLGPYTMTGLLHNTTYWWNVTVTDGAGDTTSTSYCFISGMGGGTDPTGATPVPTTGTTYQPINNTIFGLTVTDADGDPLQTTFYWANGSVIGNDSYTPSGGVATVTHTQFDLNYNTTYSWYANVNDTAQCDQVRVPSSGFYTFTTQEILVSIVKEWAVAPNNTLIVWVNTTNVGEANLTNGYINETYDTDMVFVGASPDPSGVDSGRFNITWMNTTGDSQWYNVTIWLNLSGPVANGTTITNSGRVYFNGTLINTGTFSDNPNICYYATKQCNMTSSRWNTTTLTFWINVTNCGDFYLNFVRLNESYSANLSYNSSNYPGNETNTGFNITQIAPGATNLTQLVLNTSVDWNVEIANGTKMWNNITIHANETNANTPFTMYVYSGARTTAIRASYTTIYYDMLGLSNTMFTILGVVLIIGAVMAIVYMMYIQKRDSW